jgi:hypothetical protein
MNLVEEAQELLLNQFSQSPRLKALIRSLVKPFAVANAELEKLHHGRYIDEAEGATLDIIGNIVDQPRLGMSDEDYRPWIKVAICLNNCAGTAENMLNILRILFAKELLTDKKLPVQLQENAPNNVKFIFYKNPSFPVKTLFAIMRRAAPVTTICEFIDASPPEIHSKAKKLSPEWRVFRFDHSTFDECYFADFFEGESYERS